MPSRRPPDPSSPNAQERSRQALRPILHAIQRGQESEAARLLMQAVADGAAPKDTELTKWLLSSIGRDATAKLVHAFVHFPCFYCKKGRIPCQNCGAQGRLGAETVCGRCLGMKIERCDFCAGSGWVAVSTIPEGLRPTVIAHRTRLASERMHALLAKPLPRPSRRDPSRSIKHYQSLLLNLDRQMGVFENMLLAARGLREPGPNTKSAVDAMLVKCFTLGRRGEQRIVEIMNLLADADRLLADAPDLSGAMREPILALADFHKSLGDPDRTMAGTGLEHPFLHEAIRAARADKRKS